MAENIDTILKFKKAAEKTGASLYTANTASDAVKYILRIVEDKDIQIVIKANSVIAEKLMLNQQLAGVSVRVIETSMVQLTAQLAKGQNVQIEKLAALISRASGQEVKPEPSIILEMARRIFKEAYIKADLGISEADLGIAETGKLITLESEVNDRLAAVLPRTHLTLLDCKSIAVDLTEAAEKIKGSSEGIPGRKVSNLITHLTGRNTAGEILEAKQPNAGVEEYILLINFS